MCAKIGDMALFKRKDGSNQRGKIWFIGKDYIEVEWIEYGRTKGKRLFKNEIITPNIEFQKNRISKLALLAILIIAILISSILYEYINNNFVIVCELAFYLSKYIT